MYQLTYDSISSFHDVISKCIIYNACSMDSYVIKTLVLGWRHNLPEMTS